jgi:predicted ArsR family transcriptional regulator
MKKTRENERFFESTRGRVVLLLRKGEMTVNDLATELSLTDNAVRAHLLSLERDGLVEAGGTIKGFRKPHYVYRLTDNARHLFPKFYDSLFNTLLDVLKTEMPSGTLGRLLRRVGAVLAPRDEPADLDKRVDRAVSALEGLGGAPFVERTEDKVLIHSRSCPFADAVAEHPETCQMAESMLHEIVQAPVRETCDRTATPRCSFEIALPNPDHPA